MELRVKAYHNFFYKSSYSLQLLNNVNMFIFVCFPFCFCKKVCFTHNEIRMIALIRITKNLSEDLRVRVIMKS